MHVPISRSALVPTAALAGLLMLLAIAPDVRGQSGEAPELSDVAASLENESIPVTNLFAIVRKGGLVMYPILFCSVLTVCFAFERLISLRRGRVIPAPFVRRLLQQMRDGQLDRESALELCEQNGSPAARVFAGAIRKWGRPAVEVEQGFIDAGERVGTRLHKYLRMFHAISTICPLLGLLGTVFGVIRSFNSIATADELQRSTMLASGIAEALLATAAGLGVAITALICYWVCAARADQLVVDIDALGEELVQLLSGEMGLDPHARAARVRKREALAAKTA